MYARTWERIDRERLSLKFLVCGFDNKKQSHIWLVDGENAPVCYDTIGFWSIGTGAPAALSTIAFHLSRAGTVQTLEEAIYVAVTAKFISETASDVGKSTFVAIVSEVMERQPVALLPIRYIEDLRSLWEAEGIPRIPSKAQPLIREAVKAGLATSKKIWDRVSRQKK